MWDRRIDLQTFEEIPQALEKVQKGIVTRRDPTGRPRIWPRVILSRFIWLRSRSWGGGNESGLNKSRPLNTAVEILAGYIVLYIVHATSIKYRNENCNLPVFHLLDRPAMLHTSFSPISPKGPPTTHLGFLNRI
jgi:hypothetical protein